MTTTKSQAVFRERREAFRNDRSAHLGLSFPLPRRRSQPHPQPVGTLLGHDSRTGAPIHVPAADLVGGLAILGKNGTGKTVTLQHLITADIREGRGAIVLDPHGDLTSNLLARVPNDQVDRVVLLDASDPEEAFALNPFYCPDPLNQAQVAAYGDAVHLIFKKLWADAWGATLDDLIPNAAYVLLANSPHTTMLDLPAFFTDNALRQRLLQKVRNRPVREFFEHEYGHRSDAGQAVLFRSTLARVRKFIRNPQTAQILGQGRPTVDFGRLMAERKVVLVRLARSDLGEENTALLGALLLHMITTAAFARLQLPEAARHQITLYADEFQLFATETFSELIEQARKTGVACVFAHQNLAQLPPEVRRAPEGARSLLIFQVSRKDAAEAMEDLQGEPITRPLAPNAFDLLLRSGHPHPQAVTLAGRIQALIAEEVTAATYPPQRRGQVSMAGYTRARAGQLDDAINLYLWAAMHPDADDVGHLAGLEGSLRAYFRTPQAGEDCAGLVRALGGVLKQQPVYGNPAAVELLSPSQRREQMRADLTRLPTLWAYLKLKHEGYTTEQQVTIRLPDPPCASPGTPAVIRQQSHRAYYRPRLAIEEGRGSWDGAGPAGYSAATDWFAGEGHGQGLPDRDIHVAPDGPPVRRRLGS